MCHFYIHIIQILKILEINVNNRDNYKPNTLKQVICKLN